MDTRTYLKRYFILILIMFSAHIGFLNAQEATWKQVDSGLSIGHFEASHQSDIDTSKITIIKIAPHKYSFKLLYASELDENNKTVKEWCQQYGLIAGINAGMFQKDYKTHVGYMKNFDHTNNPQINKYKSVAAFNPADTGKPDFKIYDIDEKDIQEIIDSYNTVIQNLRLIKRPGENRWSQQDEKWSEAALGMDKQGNVLFIFSRAPYTMHKFNDILINLPIDIACAQHLEGGPEASLYFSHKGRTIEAIGSFETGFKENKNTTNYWDLPNVIGFQKKE